MDVRIAWRLIPGPNETGYLSHKIGDVIAIVPADHLFSAQERTEFGIATITDIPDAKWDAIRSKIMQSVIRGVVIKNMGDGTYLIIAQGAVEHLVRRFRIEYDLCLAQWPALATQLAKLFDPEFEVPEAQIPSLTWTKFKLVFWNVPDDAAETTMED